jgi:WD40 repeat protein
MTGQFAAAPGLEISEEQPAPAQSTAWAAPAPPPSVVLPGQAGRSSATDSAGRYARSVALVGEQVAEALDYAHRQGTLHRDIKPSNLLLDGQGTVWVADFGLAKAADSEDLTHTGDIVGTVRYMAPERFEGRCDARSDVYALGLTLYELLARRPAFDKSDRAELIRQVTHEEPPRLRAVDPMIPRDLETVVHKAIDREPGRRYGDAGALAADLRRYVEGRPILARRTSPVEHAWRWCRRNPGVAVLSASVAALLVIAALGSSIAAVRFGRLAQAERQAQDDLEASLYFNRISLAAREMEARNVGRAEELLEECPRRLRGWEWHYLRRIPLARPVVLRGHTGRLAAVGYSPGGERLASIGLDLESLSHNGEVKVWDTRSGRELWTARINASGVRRGHRVAWAFSRDGRRLAVPDLDRRSNGCDIKVWDAATGQERLVLKGHDNLVVGLGFSADGQRIASADSAGRVRLWDGTTGRAIPAFESNVRPLFAVAFHPDGHRVALGGEDGTVSLWDGTTGRRLLDFRGFHTGTYCMAFNGDGTRLAAGSAFGDVKVWDTTTGREPGDLPKLPGSVFGLAFNPNEPRLAMSSDDGTIRLWDLGSAREALSFRTAMNWGIAFSHDGRSLAMALGDGTIRIVSADPIESAAWGPLLEFHHTGGVHAAVYSPDGARLATVEGGAGRGQANHVRVRDAADGRILLDVEGIGAWGSAVAFSPDGARLPAVDADGSIRIRDAASGRVLLTLGQVKATRLASSPDGRWIAANDEGTGQATKVVIWDAKTGRWARSLDAGAYSLEGLAFSRDGRRIAAIGDDLRVRVWDAETGRELWSAPAHDGWATCVAFSPDGQQIATGGGGESGLKIWDPADGPGMGRPISTGRPISALPGHPGFALCMAYSPDGLFLASGSTDQTVRIWDLLTGQEIRTLVGHTDWVTSVAFRPDGRRLASSSHDGTIKIWDLTRSLR